MKTYSKYAEQYQKRKDSCERPKFKSENDTYQQFLEVQLEKVTNALLLTKDFEERINEVIKNQQIFDEKVVKITNVVKLMQNFAEAQEKENFMIAEKIERNRLETFEKLNKFEEINKVSVPEKKINTLEGRVAKLESENMDFGKKTEFLNFKIDDIEVKIKNQLRSELDFNQFDSFREEINRKIELVMDEAGKSVTWNDFENLQKTVTGITMRNCFQNNSEEEFAKFNAKINNLKQEIEDLKYKTHKASQSKSEKSPNNSKFHLDCSSKTDLQLAEKGLIDQFTKGLDKFGDLIKKYVSIQKEHEDRLGILEKPLVLKEREELKVASMIKPEKLERFPSEIKSPTFPSEQENNPFLGNIVQTKENIDKERFPLKNRKFNDYLKNLSDHSSDLDDLLVEKEMKRITTEKTPIQKIKRKKRSDSLSRKSSQKKYRELLTPERSKTPDPIRKRSLKPFNIIKNVNLEKKGKKEKIGKGLKKDKKIKMKS